MSEFFRMNLFFTVSTVGFVIIAVLVVIVLVYIIKIIRTISRVADSVEEETEALKADIHEARASIKRSKEKGFLASFLALVGLAGKTGKRLIKKRRSS